MAATEPEAPHARIDEADGILTVTLDRDRKLNAISPQTTETLWQAVRAVADRDELRALVITAVGRYFTAGIDLAGPSPAQAPNAPSFRARYRRHHLLYDEIEHLEKPVVLAAQGPCLGAGLEMACSCDFRFAARSATFQLPEVKLGTIPGSGGVSRLTRLVGPHWAKWLAMAGRRIDADRALNIGLVHEVLPDEDFHAAVHAWVVELTALPAQAVGAAKMAIDMVVDTDAATARRIERLANSQLVYTDEFRESRKSWSA